MAAGRLAARSFISALILAAGGSRRMGRPKQLLMLGDRCILRHVLDAALGSSLDEVVLVLGHRAEEIRAALSLGGDETVRVIVNSEYARGQSTSLRLGVRSLDPRAGAVAVLLGDQPQVTASLIDRLAGEFLRADSPAARPVYTSAGGLPSPGHPVFLAHRLWPEIARIGGDAGARSVLRASPEWVTEVPVDGPAPAGIDTWEDYDLVLRSCRDGS